VAPVDPTALFQSASALLARAQLTEALGVCREALARFPGHPSFAVLLSNIAGQLGDADEAAGALAAATPHAPESDALWSSLACAANAGAAFDAERIFEFHRQYGLAVERARPSRPLEPRDPDPDRPLRVGIITYDYNARASVAFFLAPVLCHIPAGFHVTAYHTRQDDTGTGRFRALVSAWRHMPAASHDALAEQVRADNTDIALELIGHTGVRRLPAFQPRCAPLQVSYLGYSNTTGLPSMDWRIVDSVTDPRGGGADRLSTERLWRLDPCFLCFEPDPEVPPVAGAPSLYREHVTFGAYSDLFKLNDQTLRRWARVLTAVPGSRLLLKNRAPAVPGAVPFLRERLSRAGIDLRRVELRGHTPTYPSHLAAYADVDIALDTTPYNGTTTVCESLLMGVPIVGVRPDAPHDRHAARVTLSILTAAGVPELIADDEGGLVERCAELAGDPAKLNAMRPRLRERLLGSPVCDARAFGERFWAALRGMWRERVQEPSAL